MKPTPWTDIELQILRKYYADTPTAVLAAALGKPIQKVYAAAKRQGLAKSEAFCLGPTRAAQMERSVSQDASSQASSLGTKASPDPAATTRTANAPSSRRDP